MVTIYIFLMFFYGQLWRSVSMETQMPSTTLLSPILKQSRNRLARSADSSSPKTTEQASATTVTTHATAAEGSAFSDGSWIAALLIGIILTSMTIFSIIILLWKCSKKSTVVDPNWAGRSPFADGEIPEIIEESIKDMEQTTKRTSVLSILPWKFNRSTLLVDNAEGSQCKERPEKSPSCKTKEDSQSTPTLKGSAAPFAANISISSSSITNMTPLAVSDGPSNVCNPPLNPIILPSESSDLPPPPDWLNEVQENHSAEISDSLEFKSDAQRQFPLPPDLTDQDANLPLPLPPTLPQ